MKQADCRDLDGTETGIAAAVRALDDLEELSRAWHGRYDIRWIDGEWYAVPCGGGIPVIAPTATGLWLALWDARDQQAAS